MGKFLELLPEDVLLLLTGGALCSGCSVGQLRWSPVRSEQHMRTRDIGMEFQRSRSDSSHSSCRSSDVRML